MKEEEDKQRVRKGGMEEKEEKRGRLSLNRGRGMEGGTEGRKRD